MDPTYPKSAGPGVGVGIVLLAQLSREPDSFLEAMLTEKASFKVDYRLITLMEMLEFQKLYWFLSVVGYCLFPGDDLEFRIYAVECGHPVLTKGGYPNPIVEMGGYRAGCSFWMNRECLQRKVRNLKRYAVFINYSPAFEAGDMDPWGCTFTIDTIVKKANEKIKYF